MVAPVVISDRVAVEAHRALREPLARAVLVTAMAMLVALASYLAWRRSCAALQPLNTGQWLALGAGGAAWVAAIRCGWWWDVGDPLRPRWLVAVRWLLPTLTVLTLLAVLALPGTPRLGQFWAWALILASESVWLGLATRRRRQVPSAMVTAPVELDERPEGFPARRSGRQGAEAIRGEGSPASELPADVSQRWIRFESLHQGDVVEGLLRTVFAPGQRSRNVHVAFCPTMRGRPQVEVTQVSGPGARVKVADVQNFGLRFEVRLVAPSPGDEHVLIHFLARCDP